MNSSVIMSETSSYCRVCTSSDNYTNMFYNVNKDLLSNLKLLVQAEINENDGFSKWLCHGCVEQIESFIKFRNTYKETSNRLLSALEPRVEEIKDKLEALDEDFTSQNDGKDQEISSVDKQFCCDVCPKSYRYLNSLARHIKTTHERLRHRCSLCSLEFTQKTSLLEHVRNIHKDSASSNAVCGLCNRSFNTTKMLQQHKRTHCLEKLNKKAPATILKPKTKYRKQCCTCGLFFKHLDEHKLSHQTENTYKCEYPQCLKTFKFKTSLDVHLRIHTNERPFECHQCPKKFRVSHHLKEHLTTHSTEKVFVCECSKKFSSKLSLYKHSKLHMNKK